MDEKEYGLEVGWKRVWIRGWMEKKIYRKAIVLEGKNMDKKIEKIWRSAIRPLVQVYYRL